MGDTKKPIYRRAPPMAYSLEDGVETRHGHGLTKIRFYSKAKQDGISAKAKRWVIPVMAVSLVVLLVILGRATWFTRQDTASMLAIPVNKQTCFYQGNLTDQCIYIDKGLIFYAPQMDQDDPRCFVMASYPGTCFTMVENGNVKRNIEAIGDTFHQGPDYNETVSPSLAPSSILTDTFSMPAQPTVIERGLDAGCVIIDGKLNCPAPTDSLVPLSIFTHTFSMLPIPTLEEQSVNALDTTFSIVTLSKPSGVHPLPIGPGIAPASSVPRPLPIGPGIAPASTVPHPRPIGPGIETITTSFTATTSDVSGLTTTSAFEASYSVLPNHGRPGSSLVDIPGKSNFMPCIRIGTKFTCYQCSWAQMAPGNPRDPDCHPFALNPDICYHCTGLTGLHKRGEHPGARWPDAVCFHLAGEYMCFGTPQKRNSDLGFSKKELCKQDSASTTVCYTAQTNAHSIELLARADKADSLCASWNDSFECYPRAQHVKHDAPSYQIDPECWMHANSGYCFGPKVIRSGILAAPPSFGHRAFVDKHCTMIEGIQYCVSELANQRSGDTPRDEVCVLSEGTYSCYETANLAKRNSGPAPSGSQDWLYAAGEASHRHDVVKRMDQSGVDPVWKAACGFPYMICAPRPSQRPADSHPYCTTWFLIDGIRPTPDFVPKQNSTWFACYDTDGKECTGPYHGYYNTSRVTKRDVSVDTNDEVCIPDGKLVLCSASTMPKHLQPRIFEKGCWLYYNDGSCFAGKSKHSVTTSGSSFFCWMHPRDRHCSGPRITRSGTLGEPILLRV